MGYELFIASRYLKAKRKQAFISVITFISTLGIAIGVMALVIALALITGFQQDVQDKILGATSHIMVSDLSGEGLSGYQDLITRVKGVEGVKIVSPVIYDMVLISGPYKSRGGMLKGIDFDLDKTHSLWLAKLDQGSLPTDSPREGILLGKEIAFSIGASIGDVVTVLTSSSRLSPMGLIPKTKRFQVSGIFSTGLYEFDSTTALVSLRSAQKFFGLEEKINHLQIKIADIFQAPRVAEELRLALPPTTYVTTWMDLNRSLFSALKLEKNIMFLTITLIVIVAALNIIATLILMVMEKTRDIGILMAIGAPSGSIRKIFFLQGAMIGFIGTTGGALLGLLCCWLANTFQLIKVPVDIYQISYVPFHIKPIDLGIIIGVSLSISLLSTLFPSHRASKVDPVVALKYE
ncbi:MAG: lipoprotein releasing system, transrane protein, LolC/E family [Candidatus Aminicenantes bacterium]|nr:lipoprotein releasing system, transrane protein, LolC/E family [Candidatus Aminicenantes bacterium]